VHIPDRIVADNARQADHEKLIVCTLLTVVLVARWYCYQVPSVVTTNILRFREKTARRHVFSGRASAVAHVAGLRSAH
jgi:hypothetical protein